MGGGKVRWRQEEREGRKLRWRDEEEGMNERRKEGCVN